MMTRTTRSNHDRSPRVRLFGEEDASAMYKRLGHDPRKTREENMGAVDPFDRPEEEFDPSGYYDNEHGLSEAAETLADQGRGRAPAFALRARQGASFRKLAMLANEN
jgi:hypothetical protein